MKAILPILVLSLFGALVAEAQSKDLNTKEIIASRCTPSTQPIYTKDFKWGYELPEMMMKFAGMYQIRSFIMIKVLHVLGCMRA